MSLQWTLVAAFLYIEIGCMILLLFPLISPKRWKKIFASKLVTAFVSYSNFYFNFLFIVLVLLLIDSIREIRNYNSRLNNASPNAQPGAIHHGPSMELVKEFRAQRNLYIVGAALFLWFVLKRLLTIISNTANLIEEKDSIESMLISKSAELEKLSKEHDNVLARLERLDNGDGSIERKRINNND